MSHETIPVWFLTGALALIVVLLGVKKKAIKYAAGLLLVLGLLAPILPLGPPANGKGSHICARRWKNRLAACHDLDDVRARFHCAGWESTGLGSYLFVEDANTPQDGDTYALLYEFADGDWLAMVYRSSHNTWGGGTVVTRDNTGRIRTFFGHVCGRPQAFGNSREEVYTSLIDPPFPMKEIAPDQ